VTESVHHGSSGRARGRLLRLSVAGGLSFWVVNLAISLTPIAADYRSALSIAYVPMLFEALLGGLLIALGVTYCLLRFHAAIPGRSPGRKAGLLSLLALILVTLLLEVPARFFTPTPHAMRYFLIGMAINVLRIFALGFVVGWLSGRRNAFVDDCASGPDVTGAP
jgi:hypothetical protein